MKVTKTKLLRSLGRVKSHHQRGVVTLGHFDGVHLGHQQLIASTIAKARELDAPSILITFEPHAFEFFSKGKTQSIPRLTRLREKFSALAKTGIDYVLVLPFNQQLASLSASEFVAMLVSALKPQHFILGDDFRFGRGRDGDAALMRKLGAEHGFGVDQLPSFLLEGERVSSTRIRQALVAGNHRLAEKLLGRSYSMQGRIRGGQQLGRQLGFPTANIFLHRQHTPVHGIYTVYVHGIKPYPLAGVANVGTRPTVGGTRSLLEVHLLDFNQDIYGRYVEVEFFEKLRDEECYENLEILKHHIAQDVEMARAYFNKEKKVSNERLQKDPQSA